MCTKTKGKDGREGKRSYSLRKKERGRGGTEDAFAGWVLGMVSWSILATGRGYLSLVRRPFLFLF